LMTENTITDEAYTGDIVSRLRSWRGLHLAHGGRLFEEAADEIERLREQRRWIPASERLPEDRVRVLACGDDPVEGPFTLIGYREPESKLGPAHWHLPCFAEFGPVTYWMPLPEPPEVT